MTTAMARRTRGERVRDAIRPSSLGPTVIAGVIIGVIAAILSISFTTLVFGGPFAEHLPKGIGASLLGAALILAITSLTTGLPQMIGLPQDIPAVLLGVVAGGIAASLNPSSEEAFLTLILAISLTGVASALLFSLLGMFKLGDLVRFAPYPVVGGFLAGTGWLLFKGGAGVLTGTPLSLSSAGAYLTGPLVLRWLPGVMFAALLLVLVRRIGKPMVIPAMIGAGLVAFYGAVILGGSSVGEAEAGGWLIGPLPGGALWEPWVVEAVVQADWGVVMGQTPGMLAAVVLAAISLLLNLTGIELAVERDVSANRELRSTGAANAGAALVGAVPGFPALSLSVLAFRMGTRSRLSGLIAAAVVGLTLWFGAEAVGLLPRMVLGGIIMFLGLAFLVEWLWDARASLVRAEHALVVIILLVIATAGFLAGVAVGLVAAMILFVLEYSRTKLVRHALTGSTYRSSVDRASDERAVLDREGPATMVLILEGFLFFGTAHALLDRIRARIKLVPRLRYVFLDLRRVRGADSSAVMTIAKLGRLAEQHGFLLVLAGMSDRLKQAMARGGVDEGDPGVRIFLDADRGLQWCEDRTIEEAGVDPAPDSRPLGTWLRDEDGEPIPQERLLPYLERVEVAAGHEVMGQGARGDDVYFIEAGLLAVELVTPEEGRVRMRAVHPGTVVGELAMYLGTRRAASVVAETDAVLHRLTRDALDRMRTEEPELAAAIHRALARLLAERLSSSITTIQALLE